MTSTDSTESEWNLYYWSNPSRPFKGRGEYVRLMFEAAEMPYNEIEGDMSAVVAKIDCRGGLGDAPFPAFAPPVVTGPNGICVSQTSAVIAQLGKCFGFYPDEADEFNGMQIVLSIADMHADGRAPFHPVKIMGSYYDQIEEAKVAVAEFVVPGGRLAVWLDHFNHLVESANAKSSNSGYLLSGRLTYVDIAMLHVLQAIASQFPEVWEQSPHTSLKDYMARIASYPPIAAYQKSSRCRPFEGNSMM